MIDTTDGNRKVPVSFFGQECDAPGLSQPRSDVHLSGVVRPRPVNQILC